MRHAPLRIIELIQIDSHMWAPKAGEPEKEVHTVLCGRFDTRLTRTFDTLNEAENYKLALCNLIRLAEEGARLAVGQEAAEEAIGAQVDRASAILNEVQIRCDYKEIDGGIWREAKAEVRLVRKMLDSAKRTIAAALS